MFTNKDVMELRARTGVGMMDCKKALTESEGDMDKAIEYLREKGMATAAKKAGRIASEGIDSSSIIANVGFILEVNCESDFVARGDQFKAFVDEVAEYIASNNVKNVEEVITAKTEAVNAAISKIGEKISIRRYEKIVSADGVVDSYIHMGGKIGVLVEASSGTPLDDIHDVALQIAAAKPTYIVKEEVPSEEIEHEKEILKAQALNEDKPKPINIIEKMVEGRISKYYKEVCLMEQVFVKDNEKTIGQYLKAAGASIKKFVRFEMGEAYKRKKILLHRKLPIHLLKFKNNHLRECLITPFFLNTLSDKCKKMLAFAQNSVN
jgi:elongation factor Ts